ncbi:MAG TPA: sigma-70 family RNA polymerase sigma factor [Terriglobales bacterium]|nr:sigma-70 family RNA polymerase sigma factor [Terriglobales bacterium]
MPAPDTRRDLAWVDDAELAAAAEGGDQAAWAALVRRYQHLVYALARRHGLEPDDAGEVFHAVYAELWAALAQLPTDRPLGAWLAAAARRHCQAQTQTHQRWVQLTEFEAPTAGKGSPTTPLDDASLRQAERQQDMRRAWERLPPRCRRQLEGLFCQRAPPDPQEIGRHPKMSGGSAGFLRRRCLRKLRQALPGS